jgi:hypothetical protein
MTIEIKQLHVKSSVVQRSGSDNFESFGEDRKFMDNSVKEEILAECRQLILELLRNRKER